MRLAAGDDWAEDHHDVELMDAAGRCWRSGGCPRAWRDGPAARADRAAAGRGRGRGRGGGRDRLPQRRRVAGAAGPAPGTRDERASHGGYGGEECPDGQEYRRQHGRGAG